jgi:succinoglycan biosynthesis transport protein ExoP
MDEINLLDYIRLVIRRKWTVLGVTGIVVLLTGIALMVMPKTYEGEATLIFPQKSSDTLSSQFSQIAGLSMLGGLVPGLSGRDVYVTVLKSRTLGEAVLKDMGLDGGDLDYEDMQDHLTLEMPKEGGLIIRCQVPSSWLEARVPRKDLRSKTAQMAAKMANSYVAELRAYDQSNCLFMSRKQRIFVQQQLDRTLPELRAAENRLRDFQQRHPTLIPPEESQAYARQALELTSSQVQADVALDETKAQLARARSTWKAGAPESISPEAIADSPAIQELQLQLARLEVRRAALLENVTAKHPDVVSLDQEIAKTYERLRSEIDRVVSGESSGASPAQQELLKQLVLLEVNSDGLDARKSALASSMSNIERRLSRLPEAELQYARLLRDVKAAETVYTTLIAELAKARIAEGRESNNFIVLDEAIVPKKPAKPRVKLTLAAALLMGMMLGVLVATARGVPPGKKSE